jgi:hypothetical protein
VATQGPFSLPSYFNVDADFRLWGSTINTALAALGLVQTADTGQINWTTVLKPASGNVYQGYEIWRFADSLQATVPIFFKLEYGSGGSTTNPGMALTVGSSSNGTGTITGQVATRQVFSASGSTSVGSVAPTLISGSSSEFYLAANLNFTVATLGFFASVARLKDATAADTGDGAVMVIIPSSAPFVHQYIPPSGAVPTASVTLPVIAPYFNTRSSAGAAATICPMVEPIAGAWRYSKIGIIYYADVGSGGTVTLTMFGGTHTLFVLGFSCNGGSPSYVAQAGTSGSGSAGLVFPWE